MKTIYMAGPRMDPPVGESMLLGLLSGLPKADSIADLQLMLKPGVTVDTVEIIRITVESIPSPEETKRENDPGFAPIEGGIEHQSWGE